MYNNYRPGILLFDILCSMLLALIGITACTRVLVAMSTHFDDLYSSIITLNHLVGASHNPESASTKDDIVYQMSAFSSEHALFGSYQLPPDITIQVKTARSLGRHAMSITTAHVML